MTSFAAGKVGRGIPGGANKRPPRTMRGKTLRRTFFLFVILVVTAVAAAVVSPTTRWIESPGYIMTDQEVEIRPSVEGAIAGWMVQTGDVVQEGQLLMQLNNSVQQAAYEAARAELDARRAQLRQVQSAHEYELASRAEQIHQARQSLALAESQLGRMQEANARGGGYSPKEIEDATLRVELSRSRLNEVLLSRATVMDDQVAVLTQQIETAQKQVALHQAELALREVRSPMSGFVYFNRHEPGEVVKPEHVLGQVFDRRKWVIKMRVNERSLGFVELGQTVEVAAAAYPSFRFGYMNAQVIRILPIVTPRPTGDGIFYVEAEIEPQDRLVLHPGMTATGYINAGRCTWLQRIMGW